MQIPFSAGSITKRLEAGVSLPCTPGVTAGSVHTFLLGQSGGSLEGTWSFLDVVMSRCQIITTNVLP